MDFIRLTIANGANAPPVLYVRKKAISAFWKYAGENGVQAIVATADNTSVFCVAETVDQIVEWMEPDDDC